MNHQDYNRIALSVENNLNESKEKEFDYDYETLKILQLLEIRQLDEKTQFAEDLYKLRTEYRDKRTELENNISARREEVSQKLEEAKMLVQRVKLELEKAQLAMDHLLDSKTKLLEDLSDEFEESESKLLEDYEIRQAATLKEIQNIEYWEK